ncbi:hypothetical protein [Streptomyces sp. NBC_01803]|uniref:hypothetical protein n=1 Tax=Streptomyces sp. NBC_01803 TaxID=2975946 RepID=UPI002DD7DAAC|nr:hypothetical protein [Streptomyces sp. NBC_01803]WSA44971.1 hypothetical protein OIE51_12575 [Streptomyces sp. NBC_01803]
MTRLRPGPAITGPAARAYDGGGVLARRYGRWLWPRDEERRSVTALALRLAGSGLLTSWGATAVQGDPRLMWPATGIGLYAAWRAGGGSGPEDGAQEQPDDAGTITGTEFVELVRALIGPGSGVHLAEVAERLAEVEPGRAWDTADVRELAALAGVPVNPTRSRTRAGSSTGIRARDLPPPSPDVGAAPSGVVAAGQTANNNSDNVTVDRHGEGLAIIRRPADRARHHTVRGGR